MSFADDIVQEIIDCRECGTRADGSVFLCGWHENLAAALAAVAKIVHNSGNVSSTTDGD